MLMESFSKAVNMLLQRFAFNINFQSVSNDGCVHKLIHLPIQPTNPTNQPTIQPTIQPSSSHPAHVVIKWKHFPRYWSFVRGIHRSSMNSPHKGQWRGALRFCLTCAWTNGWVNNPHRRFEAPSRSLWRHGSATKQQSQPDSQTDRHARMPHISVFADASTATDCPKWQPGS